MNGAPGNNFTNRKKQWEWKEADLLADITSLKISALTHASKIAPLVTNCTLGNLSSNNLPSSPKGKKYDIKISIKNDLCKNKDKNFDEKTSPEKSSLPTVDKKYELKISVNNELCKRKDKLNGKTSVSIPNISRKVEVLDYEILNNTILYKTIEKQRVEQVKQQEQEFIQKIIKEEDNKLKQIYEESLQDQKEWTQRKVEYEQQLVEEAERKTKSELEKRKKELNELRKKTENKLRMIAIDGILKYQKRFKLFYERIVKLMKSASMMALPNCEEYNKSLKMLVTIFDQLKQKVKNEIIGPTEVKSAENLCLEIEKLEQNLIDDLENFEKRINDEIQNVRNETKKALEEQNKINGLSTSNIAPPATTVVDASVVVSNAQNIAPNENQTQASMQQPKPPENQGTISATNTSSSADNSINTMSCYVSSERLEFYNNIMTFYTKKVEAVKALQAEDSMKKYRFACQKAINTPVNAISGVSPQHLQDKFDKIFSFIAGNPLKTSDGAVISTLDHPLGRDYCLLLLAKKFVSQGDSLISSNALAAFPIASIIISIWKNIPDFGLLFLAYTFKESPYLVPYFLPKHKGQTNEDYLKSLGYKTIDGVLEKQDMYLKRQAGYMRLYAAIMITDSRSKDVGLQHPYGLENGWKWLCNLLNLEPLPDICATLIFEFLQIVGCDMWKMYGNQFAKMLITIQQEYFPKLSKVDEGGPKSRLEVFLQKVIQDGKLSQPTGTLAKNFW